MDIIRREASCRQWRRIGLTIRPQRGRAISRVTVPTELGDTTYATREGVETQASAVIAQRYKTARGAPILQNKDLFMDFGYIADTEANLQVLQGTYNIPNRQIGTQRSSSRNPVRSTPSCPMEKF